jgi:hypothetical protein
LGFLRPRYFSFGRSLDFAKRNQPSGWNPRKPNTDFARTFYNCIASHLTKGRDWLHFFVTVGTSLDFWYGVDMVIEYRGVIVTVDLTTRREKPYFKADFLLTIYDIWADRFYNIGQVIANRLRENCR